MAVTHDVFTDNANAGRAGRSKANPAMLESASSSPSTSNQPRALLPVRARQRSSEMLPRQGSKKPWKLHQNYALDLMSLRFGSVNDGTMEFTRLPKATSR